MYFGKRKGLHYESQARQHLMRKGLKCLEQNYHSRYGEIDLIMQDVDMLCFVEVKFRKSLDFGGAASSISHRKQQRIIKTAQYFMQNNQKLKNQGMRFDAMILQQSGERINIDWIQNAFYAEPF